MQFNPVSRNGSLARRALVAFSSNLAIFVIVWIGVFYSVGGSGFAFTILDATADNREKIHSQLYVRHRKILRCATISRSSNRVETSHECGVLVY